MLGCLQSTGSCVSSCVTGTGWCVAGVVGFAASPIIGVVGAPFQLLKALYHYLQRNKHQDLAKNESGNAFNPQASYMQKNALLGVKDLTGLQHELAGIKEEKSMYEALKWARGLAKCILPYIGAIWALCTEINTNGSIALGCEGCGRHDDHWSKEDALRHHIQRLEDAVRLQALASS